MVSIVKCDKYRSQPRVNCTDDMVRVEMRMSTYEWRQVMLALRKAGIKMDDSQ
jgi:hypothetical protein